MKLLIKRNAAIRVLLINALGQSAVFVAMMAVNAAIWSQVIAAVLSIVGFLMLYVLFIALAIIRPMLLMSHQVTELNGEPCELDDADEGKKLH